VEYQLFVDYFPGVSPWVFLIFPYVYPRVTFIPIYCHPYGPPALQEALQVLQSMTHFGLLGDVPWRENKLGKNNEKLRQVFDDFDGFSMIFGHDGWWQRSL
jgi:hypothetical protein